MTHNAKPILLSWNTCDGVHLDHSTGKYFLLGVFSGIRVRDFPATHPRMFWFLVVTELVEGSHQLKISFGPPTDEPRVIIDRPFESKSPTHRIHLINEIKNLPLERPDNYSVVIEIDDDPILATSFPVSN